jgi:hypothetical protein
MRFMMVLIPKGYQSATPEFPSPEAAAKGMEYNKSLGEAGVLLALDGLFPPPAGARISYSGGKSTVTDGPFAEAKEVIGGYWILKVRSLEEAIEWARKAPMSDGDMIEVRQLFEMGNDDFHEDEQQAAEGSENPPYSGSWNE